MSNITFENTDDMNKEMSALQPISQPPEQRLGEKMIQKRFSSQARTEKELAVFNTSSVKEKDVPLFMSALYKSPESVVGDANHMLQMIDKYYGAYAASSTNLKGRQDFNQHALEKNTAVFDLMAPEKQRDPELAKTYLIQVMTHSKPRKINGHDVVLPPHQVNPNVPIDMKKYEDAYIGVLKMAASGRKTVDDILVSEERQYMAIAKHLAKSNPDLQAEIDKTERAVVERNLPAIENLMRHNAMTRPGMEPIYEEAQRHFPDMKQKMDKAQQEYWLSPEQLEKVGKAAARLEHNTRHPKISRTKEDYEFAQDAEKTLKEAQKRVKDREVREASLAYLKQSSIDYIYSLASDGLISMDDAAICVGMISSIPTISKASATHSGLIYASVNDYDNIDFQTPQEAMEKRAAELKERIIDTDAKLNTAEQQIYGAKTQAQNKSWAYAHPEYDRAQTQEIQMSRGHK